MRSEGQPRARRPLVLGVAVVWLAVCAVADAWAQGQSLELGIKAAYLYKLGPFIAWPESAFPAPTAPVQLCVAGDNPFGATLARSVADQHIGNRPIVVRLLPVIGRGSGCHILYIAGSSAQGVADALAMVAGEPILAITDSARDPQVKGIIHFVIHEDRVRFEIDDLAATHSGLGISSKVLDLAVAVRSRTPGAWQER